MNKKEILSYNLKVLKKTHNLTQNDAASIFVFMDICKYFKIEPKKILTKKIKFNYELIFRTHKQVSISACCNDLSNRYWDKNGGKCLKCGKIFTS